VFTKSQSHHASVAINVNYCLCEFNIIAAMKHIIYSFIFISFFRLSANAQKLFPILLKDKWGYMNQEGKVVITPKYDIAQEFNEGFAVVALGNQPCLINVSEQRVIDTGIYQFISRFNEGRCAVRNFEKQWFYINATGKIMLKLDSFVYEANPFYNGLARVSRQMNEVTQKYYIDVTSLAYRFAYIKKDGKYACEFIYRDAENFENNIARVKENTMTFLIDNTFTKKCKETTEIGKFNEGIAVFIDNGKFGYINDKGEIIIPAQYDYASMFYNGLAEVEILKKVCYINTAGVKQFEPTFEELRPFAEGFAGFKLNGKYGFINGKGEMMMQPYYDDVAYFANGLCPVRKGSKWGAINKEGKLVLKLDFDFVGTFEDGVAEIIYKDISLYTDLRGNILPIWDK
jgi:hypothetical protein